MKINWTLKIGLYMFAFLLFIAILGPYLPFIDGKLQQDKYRIDEERNITLPPYERSWKNLLGSDRQGVDQLSKIVVGAKDTISIVFAIVLVRYAIAVPLGLLAYKRRGPFHLLLSGWNQVFSSLPTIFAAVLLMNLPFLLLRDDRLAWVIFILASIEVGRVAYIVQQQAGKLSNEPFVEAGTALGNNQFGLIKRYYLPHLYPEIVVNFCIDLSKTMLLLGQLGILSIFLTQEWVQQFGGAMLLTDTGNNWTNLLAQHRGDILRNNFSFIFYPVYAIMFVILTFNILGEGLKKHYNKRINAN
ncbi:ABC transporter permease [Bacillus horti]|uniref:Peptide/nickel transport system permease protein n=1 Tax=Caldalkalibacillus horti TaxID=77523 RepID=A0ABT9W200_9BACI|nr:ABC transporter permease subunit [Bacillus horti]MDQ0167266.1 peptide/nickel transport system permease protein [Bacillus horti]